MKANTTTKKKVGFSRQVEKIKPLDLDLEDEEPHHHHKKEVKTSVMQFRVAKAREY